MDDSAQSIISSLHEVPSAKTLPSSEGESPPLLEEQATSAPSEPATPPVESAAEPPAEKRRIRPSDPMIVFAYECLRREFNELAARRPAHDKPPSTDDVHRMRIAMRRLRVALRLFRRMLPREAKEFRKGLRAFARALSDTRDLDVHADVFRTYAQTVPAESLGDLGGYELHLRRERGEARARMVERFSDDRYDELLDSFGALLEDAPSPGATRRWHSFKVSDGVDKYLKKSVKRVLKLGRKVGDEAHAKDLHRLRIRAKRLRYELEFFAFAYKSLDKAALEAKGLQDLLGEHQDACTASERLERYARSLRKRAGASMPAALDRLAEGERQRARDVRQAFPATWRRFERSVARGRIAT
ncbi:MAG TPA: CHAD domain-containing protein [Candidatus Cybelea sp.]|jgi:CHAD domain-containing protein